MLTRRHFLASAAIVAGSGSIAPSGADASGQQVTQIARFRFTPDPLVVRPGDTVTWINRDIVPHTVTAVDESWDTGEIAPGSEGSIVVTAGLSADYFCRFHPSMKATLQIDPKASFRESASERPPYSSFTFLRTAEKTTACGAVSR